jgi:glycosyltransferase involved in cell wall biosynthesis
MKITIITPTLQRSSLIQACNSVDRQSFREWQHIVMVDRPTLDLDLLATIRHSQRQVMQCPKAHHNYGNTCRHNAWEVATGDYCLMLDDDNYLTDDDVLKDVAASLYKRPRWALYPIMRRGKSFFNDPPGLKLTDTANVVVRRNIARWPNIAEYAADGRWIEGLKAHPYEAFPAFRPIVNVPVQSKGRMFSDKRDIGEKVARIWRAMEMRYSKRRGAAL